LVNCSFIYQFLLLEWLKLFISLFPIHCDTNLSMELLSFEKFMQFCLFSWDCPLFSIPNSLASFSWQGHSLIHIGIRERVQWRCQQILQVKKQRIQLLKMSWCWETAVVSISEVRRLFDFELANYYRSYYIMILKLVYFMDRSSIILNEW